MSRPSRGASRGPDIVNDSCPKTGETSYDNIGDGTTDVTGNWTPPIEVGQALFEFSADGITWDLLGNNGVSDPPTTNNIILSDYYAEGQSIQARVRCIDNFPCPDFTCVAVTIVVPPP